jgi:hypothetical protein
MTTGYKGALRARLRAHYTAGWPSGGLVMMPRLSFICAAFALAMCAMAPPSVAWGPDGHRVVCAVAWDDLKPETRAKVQELLDIKSRDEFAELCNWADEYRNTHPETGAWHVIHVPKDALAIDMARDCPAPKSCIVDQLNRNIETLRGSAAKADKATALKFVMHFVGDLHQPLHIGLAADRGGADIKGMLLGKPISLHDVWDTGLLESRGVPWQQTVTDIQRGTSGLDRQLRAKGTPLEWANEVRDYTRMPQTDYYENAGNFEYGEVYVAQNLFAVMDLMTRAAIRLAYVLNTDVK